MTNTKNPKISARILALVASGMPVDQAIDTVLGAGSFRALADRLHDKLNGK